MASPGGSNDEHKAVNPADAVESNSPGDHGSNVGSDGRPMTPEVIVLDPRVGFVSCGEELVFVVD